MKNAAAEAEATAQTIVQRAREHVLACQTALSGFDTLDQQIDHFTINALRDAGRLELPDELRTAAAQRQEARDKPRRRRTRGPCPEPRP